jgi:hypothetical protein
MRADELIVAPHSFLEGMCEQHLSLLSEAAMRASFAEGEWIFREGEPANRFYLIQEGSVFITSRTPGHSQIVIQTVGSGDALGGHGCSNRQTRNPSRSRERETSPPSDIELMRGIRRQLSVCLCDRLVKVCGYPSKPELAPLAKPRA